MDIILLISTTCSIIGNIVQFFLNKKEYNIIYIHSSLMNKYLPFVKGKEFTSYSKARKASRYTNCILFSTDTNYQRYDFVVLPVTASILGNNIVLEPDPIIIEEMINHHD